MNNGIGGRLAMHGERWRPKTIEGDLSNFRNDGKSNGYDGYSWVKQAGKVVIEEGGLLAAYDIVRSIVGAQFFAEHYLTGVGNPPYVEHDGYRLTSSDVTAVYNLWQLQRWMHAPRHVVEIGPGFGALAALMRRMWPDTRITLVDLPERHSVLHYYLGNTVGLQGIDITTEPPHDPGVVIALRCLMEMPVSEIRRYLDWLQSLDTVQFFYIINRYLKYRALKHYPFDGRWIPLVTQTEVPFRTMHELLLQRTNDSSALLAMTLETLPPYITEDQIYDLRGEYTASRYELRPETEGATV